MVTAGVIHRHRLAGVSRALHSYHLEACALKLPLEVPGVNFNPAFPSAKVMKSPLLMTVVPLFLNNVPPVIPVILKWVTSAPSAGLREITSPEVVCVFALVVALVTEGVSATGVMLKLTVAGALVFGSATPLVVPLSSTVYWKITAPPTVWLIQRPAHR